MKILTLSIVTVLVIGISITAYANEPIEFITKNLIPEKNSHVYTNITELPDIITWNLIETPGPKDEARVIQAIERGFEIWEEHNPTLNFERVDEINEFPDIIVHWNMIPSDEHAGLAVHRESYKGTITIQMGDYNCESRFVEHSSDYLTNITMHEIGHLLGLGHTTEVDHLMYNGNDLDAVDNLDTLGYNIPENLEGEGYFVGQKSLADRRSILDQKIDDLDQELDSIDQKIDNIDQKIDDLDQELDSIDQKMDQILAQEGLTQDEYFSLKTAPTHVVNAMNPLVDEWNSIIDERNSIIDERNPIIDERNHISRERNHISRERNHIIDEYTILYDALKCFNEPSPPILNNSHEIIQDLENKITILENRITTLENSITPPPQS